MTFGSVPLSQELVDRNANLLEAKCAGVVCGGASGLLALVFHSEPIFQTFVANNPLHLPGAAMTALGPIHAIWLRPCTLLPANFLSDGMSVIVSGIVPVFAAPDLGVRCEILQSGAPVELDLAELNFSGCCADGVSDWALQQKFGPPMLKIGARRRRLNESYWGAVVSILIGVQFDLTKGVFVASNHETSATTVLELSQTANLVATVLRQAKVPAGEINPTRIRGIMDAIKMFYAISTATTSDAYSQFARICLERRAGAILSKQRTAAACRQFMERAGFVADPENRLRQKLKAAIFQQFRIGESHDHGRAFRGLALRVGQSEAVSGPTNDSQVPGMAIASTDPE